jgi:ADP-heptose:LPS heptosyltransferase
VLTHVLVARMDRLGDVLLSGPLVRAVAATAEKVTYLCSPAGVAAARLLPAVDDIVVDRVPWIDADPLPATRAGIESLVQRIGRLDIDVALILTSFHQSALPLALVLRMAGVARIGAVSADYPGSLLDVRHLVEDDVHEVERSLSLAAAMGYRLPVGDEGKLRITADSSVRPPVGTPTGDYVVVHPGASVPARAWRADRHAAVVAQLSAAGWPVAVTGGPGERALTAQVAGSRGVDLGGQLDLSTLAVVIGGARVIVVGNTGPAHLAAAVGTPVASLYAPTVPAVRWRPWKVPHILLGDQDIQCGGCRARLCPVPGHPCLDELDADLVVGAVRRLATADHTISPDATRMRYARTEAFTQART